MPDDSELLRRYAVDRDEQAFAELVQRHLPVVYNAALRRVNGHAHFAEEVTQTVFTELACQARPLSRHPALLGWLHTSTRYASATLLRREQRLAARHELLGAMHLESDSPVAWERVRPLIDDTLDQLSAADRHAVLLRYFANKSFAAIGADLQVSEDAARKRVDRAVDRLRREFVRRGVTTSVSALAAALSVAPSVAVPAPLASSVACAATAAATTATTSTGTSFVAAMSSLKFSSATLLLCSLVGFTTIGAASFSWWHDQQTREAQLTALADVVGRHQVQVHRLASTRAPMPPVPGAQREKPPTDRTAEQMREQYAHGKLLQTSPLYAPIRQQTYRLQAQREFGAFIAARAYAKDKAELLRSALVNYYEARHAAALENMTRPADGGAQFHRDLEAALAKLVTEIRPGFSEDEIRDVRRCLDAQQSMPDARAVSVELADAGYPLNRLQELALATIISEQDKITNGGTADRKRARTAVDPPSGLSAEDQALLDDASAFLSADQLRGYAAHLRDSNAEQALRKRAREIVDRRESKS